jgi:hypothetical protein
MPASDAQLTEWAETTLRINHLNTLIAREIAAQNFDRAAQLSHRAQQRAWKLLNEMFEQAPPSQKAIASQRQPNNQTTMNPASSQQ